MAEEQAASEAIRPQTEAQRAPLAERLEEIVECVRAVETRGAVAEVPSVEADEDNEGEKGRTAMKKDVSEIIRTKKKGFRLARPARAVSAPAAADSAVVATSPNLDELKAKYLPQDMLAASVARAADSSDESDLEMHEIEPDTDTGADPDGPGRKAVIIDKRSGEIIGEQG